MIESIARHVYYAVTASRGEKVREKLRELMSRQCSGEETLRGARIKKAKALILHAVGNVPYYRERYKVKPSDVARCGDDEFLAMWKEIPMVEKQDVLCDVRAFISDAIGSMKTESAKTSGSTGTPLYMRVNADCWAVRHAREMQCRSWHGISCGEKYAFFWGEHWTARSRMTVKVRDFLLNRTRVSAFRQDPGYMDSSHRRLSEFKPSFMMGYPSAIADFCAFLKGKDSDLKSLELKAVMTTAEPLREHQRELISEVCGCGVFSQYGGAEQGFVAAECPRGGFHIFSDAVWVDGYRAPSYGNGTAEAVVTDLELTSMPLIKYRTGDEIVFKDGYCSCGMGYPLLERVEGRSGERVVLPNGREINANLPSYIFKNMAKGGEIRRYRFVDRGGGKLHLQLVVTPKYSSDTRKMIIREAKSAFGEDIGLSIEEVDELPALPNAKHRDYVKEAK